MKYKVFVILGISLLLLSAYWRTGLKDFKPGKFFYMAEGQLIYSYIAMFLGILFLGLGLFDDKSLKLRKWQNG